MLTKGVRTLGSFNKKTARRPERVAPEKLSEMIRLKAYEIYNKRGSNAGDQMGDWLVAERQVKRELGLL